MSKFAKRILSGLLAGVLMMPSAAFAARQGRDEMETDEPEEVLPKEFSAQVQARPTTGFEIELTSNAKMTAKEDATCQITASEGHTLTAVQITIDEKEVLELTEEKLTASNDLISASLTAWPEIKYPEDNSVETATLTLKAEAAAADEHTIAVSMESASKTEYRVNCLPAGKAGNVSSERDRYYAGDEVIVTAEPQEGYRLKSLKIKRSVPQDGKKDEVAVEQTFTGSGTMNEWTVTWGASDESITTIKGVIASNIEIVATFEEIPDEYTVRVTLDDGLSLVGSVPSTVTEKKSIAFHVEAKTGYTVNGFQLLYDGDYYTWNGGPSILVSNTSVRVNSKGNEVSFTLNDVYGHIQVDFFSGYDENNIPVTVNENSHVTIDTNVGSTVGRGDDAEFYIATTSDRYSIKEIQLKVGDYSGTAKPDAEYIRVGNRRYEIESMGGGEYTLYVDNISEPVVVEATVSSSTTVSRPTLTIRSASNLKITKSVSSSRIDAGDDVWFYFTPNQNYHIDEITVKLGENSRTVGANKTSIRIDGVDYRMSRDANGVVTLYLTDIEENVTVSATAYYSRDPITPTNSLTMDKTTRTPFMYGDPNGLFRPEDSMSRGEAVVMLYRLCNATTGAPTSSVYHDVPLSSWYAVEINAFAEAGIIDRSSYFYPERSITRGELVEMLYRLDGSPAISSSSLRFSDTSANAVRYAATRGWVNGYSDGTFRPYNYITRAEVAALVTRVLGRTSGGGSIGYRDVPAGYWGYRYIQLASSYV